MKAPSTCPQPGCPELTTGGRCEEHRHRRPSASSRGYGTEHKQARAALVATLPTHCAYGCGTILTTPKQLVAAHVVDGQPDYGWHPSCRRCNERAKATP